MIVKQSTRQIPPKNVIQAYNTAAANTAVTITVTAVPDRFHVLHKVLWSYNNSAPAGGLYIQNGAGNNVYDIDIIAGGPGGIDVNLDCTVNTALIVTLRAVASIVGKLNIEYSTEA